MAREVRFQADAVWYAPIYDGDRRDDPADAGAFRVKIRPLTGAELGQLEQRTMGRPGGGRMPNFVARAQQTQDAIVGAAVLEVQGYRAVVNGRTYEPKTGVALVEAIRAAGASELTILEDILEAIKDESRLREGVPNGSSSPSASS